MIKLLWQKKLGLELESPMKKKIDVKISLSKLRIFIIILSKRLKEFVGRIFAREKYSSKGPVVKY